MPSTTPPSLAPTLRLAGLPFFLFAMPVMFAVAPTPTGVFGPAFAIFWLLVNRGQAWTLFSTATMTQLVTAMGVWGLLGMLWAIDGKLAGQDAALFLLECVPLTLLAHACAHEDLEREPLACGLLAGLACAGLLLALQMHFGFLIRSLVPGADHPVAGIKLNVPAAALAITCWVGLGACAKRQTCWRVLGVGSVLLVAWAAAVGEGSAPRLALIVGAVTFVATLLLPRAVLAGIALGTVLLHVLSPFLGRMKGLVNFVTDHSWLHRLDIWNLTGQLIWQRPWLGYGFKNSDAIPTGTAQMPLTHLMADLPSYPHNVLLQVQLEQGVPGVLLFYAALAFVLWKLHQQPPISRAVGASLIASGLSVWVVGYPLTRGHWVGWMCFTGIAFTAAAPAIGRRLAPASP